MKIRNYFESSENFISEPKKKKKNIKNVHTATMYRYEGVMCRDPNRVGWIHRVALSRTAIYSAGGGQPFVFRVVNTMMVK